MFVFHKGGVLKTLRLVLIILPIPVPYQLCGSFLRGMFINIVQLFADVNMAIGSDRPCMIKETQK